MKIRNYLGLIAVLLICVACPNDDDGLIEVPVRDRGEQALEDDEEIMTFLQTHFYNYEEFEAQEEGFDYVVRFGLIEGDNSDKTPIIDREELDTIMYSRSGALQTLYILNARQGTSEQAPARFSDSTLVTYTGTNLNSTQFDASPNPVWFDLVGTIDGFQRGISGFRAAGSGPILNEDGTASYEGFSSGAIFIPSGLAYFNQPPPGVDLYSSLVFTFNLYEIVVSDHDGDGIPSFDEDLNDNFFLFDDEDNPDEDAVAAFQDPDDDNDGVLTKLEIIRDENGEIVSYLDTDNDGINDLFDTDDDNDGILTIDEIEVNNVTGEVTFPDEDGDGTPDYLDPDN